MTDIDRSIKAAAKKLPFKTRKQQNALLEYAADDLADAYRIGAEDAQQEILTRLRLLAVPASGVVS